MKLGTVLLDAVPVVVAWKEGYLAPVVNPDTGKEYHDMISFITEWGNGETNLWERWIDDNKRIEPGQVQQLSPIVNPRHDMVCIGLNYQEHIEEGERFFQQKRQREAATYFGKRMNRCIGVNEAIALHKDLTTQLDYECELGVIIGKPCRKVKSNEALEYIFGYTVVNDVTARDLQKKHGQWFIGKGLDDCTPVGPYIVTKDEINWPLQLNMTTKVNGEIRQNSNTSFMIRSVNEIIEELSAAMTLFPGDIIATGTPSGVGFGFNPPRFLKDGDLIECTIEHIGTLANKVSG